MKVLQATHTFEQFNEVIKQCRALAIKKSKDYGPSWRIMRPSTLTDQIYIKATRIRTIQQHKAKIDENQESEFIGIVNYGIFALIQLEKGWVERPTISPKKNHEIVRGTSKDYQTTHEKQKLRLRRSMETYEGIINYGSHTHETPTSQKYRRQQRQNNRLRRSRCQLPRHGELCSLCADSLITKTIK